VARKVVGEGLRVFRYGLVAGHLPPAGELEVQGWPPDVVASLAVGVLHFFALQGPGPNAVADGLLGDAG
jgi:hypothetical protein